MLWSPTSTKVLRGTNRLLGMSTHFCFLQSNVQRNSPVARMPIPPALDTAATNSGVDIQDIPGRTIGYLHLNKEVIRVETVAAVMVEDFKAKMEATHITKRNGVRESVKSRVDVKGVERVESIYFLV